MRQREVRRLYCEITIGEKIDIDRTRAPTLFLGALAPKHSFDNLSARKQIMGCQIGFDRDGTVHEGRLLLDSPRRGNIFRGTRAKNEIAFLTEQCDRPVQRVAHVTKVSAKADQRLNHAAAG